MRNAKPGFKNNLLTLLTAALAVVMFASMLSSCGKETAASPQGLNTQLNIINVSPDIYPVDFYIGLRKYSTKSYYYSIPSEYFYMSTQETPIQLRTLANRTIFTRTIPFATNCKYTLFVTGLVADKTDTAFLVADTSSIPTIGRAKVRFINASAKTVNVDLYANGTLAFKNQGFKAISNYLEIPAGIYDFKVYLTGTTTIYTDLPTTTVQDGRLYTIYTRGVVGRTDSAIFRASIITNR